jgi:acyl-CoA dehydrogenase
MEVLERVGTPEQKERWLKPLLNGEIRSAYAMTEPDLASSDAKNIACRARLVGDEYVIDGEKYYISGAGDPRCKILITMVQTDPEAPPHLRQSQILVPTDTPGFEILGPMTVFGKDDAPHGHMHLRFTDCRVPKENLLLGEGRGFEISQVRLGPGRIHHCMRSIGAAERAIKMMAKRGLTRTAFGKPIAQLGKNVEMIARTRIETGSWSAAPNSHAGLKTVRTITTRRHSRTRAARQARSSAVPDRGLRSPPDQIDFARLA